MRKRRCQAYLGVGREDELLDRDQGGAIALLQGDDGGFAHIGGGRHCVGLLCCCYVVVGGWEKVTVRHTVNTGKVTGDFKLGQRDSEMAAFLRLDFDDRR